jgi:photosystem II stability/assembly factor-like uncharacterized protein
MKLFSAPKLFAFLILILLVTPAFPQSAPQTRYSRTTESLRGVSVVSQEIAWASGAHGTYLRTTDGRIWIPEQVPGAEALDFRAVVAFSAYEAFLMSAGSGDQSRIYHTTDAGRHWSLQFTNKNPKGFFDSMVFWGRTHGIVLGDPVPSDTGALKFELMVTDDGETWASLPSTQLPPALEGEGAFAASNSCLAILPSAPTSTQMSSTQMSSTQMLKSGPSAPREPSEKDGASAPAPDFNIWFATGGNVARVFRSSDRGRTWQVFDTPIVHGADSEGIFSIAFRDASHGVIAGGDYKHPDQDGPNLAFTSDGGKSWTLSQIFPQSYYSAVAYDRRMINPNSRNLNDDQANARLFLVGPKFIYDFRPPHNPTRIGPRKKSGLQFNAVAPYPAGGSLVVGPKGSIAVVP